MRLFDRLKPHHIQQDKLDSCSLASALMIINSVKNLKWTQDQLRKYIKQHGGPMLREWAHVTNGYGRGCSIWKFEDYLDYILAIVGIEAKIKRHRLKDFSTKDLKEKFQMTAVSLNEYIILNYSAHFSPLGDADDKTMTILDVDYDERYGKEYPYGEGQGEDKQFIGTFRRRYYRNRQFLHITVDLDSFSK